MRLRPVGCWRSLVGWLAIMAVVISVMTPAFAQTQSRPAASGTRPAESSVEDVEATAPQPEQQRPSVWGEPTEVRVGIYVIDVDGVDSANQRFSASVYLQARWNIPLLRHKGPAPLIRRTTSVWTPRLALVNEQQS
jgi:hypothetical protein